MPCWSPPKSMPQTNRAAQWMPRTQRGPRSVVGLVALICESVESKFNQPLTDYFSGFLSLSSGFGAGLVFGAVFAAGFGAVSAFGAAGFSVVTGAFGGVFASGFGADVIGGLVAAAGGVFAGGIEAGFSAGFTGFDGEGTDLGAGGAALATAAVLVVAVLAAATADGGACSFASSVTGLAGGGLNPAGASCFSTASGLGSARTAGCPPFAEARLPGFCEACVRCWIWKDVGAVCFSCAAVCSSGVGVC